MTLHITVVTGGSTPERDVALAGAGQVVAALRDLGHHVRVVDTTTGELSMRDQERILIPVSSTEPPNLQHLADLAKRELGPDLVAIDAIRNTDVVFLVLHGRQGEGGSLQAVLEMADVPFTGSDSLGSALAMDKDLAKRLMRSHGIETPNWAMWPVDDDRIRALGSPVVVKPSRVGSSVGLSVVERLDDVPGAVEAARAFDDQIMLEQYVEGRELTVGILADTPLAVGEIIPRHRTFDYECKYITGMSEEIFPAEIPETLTADLRRTAFSTHQALKLRGFSRVDFRVDRGGAAFVLEANTVPGLTGTSLFPQSAAAAGIAFPQLCERICLSALRARGRGTNREDAA